MRRLGLIGVLLFAPALAGALTVSNLITNVRNQIQDASSTRQRYSDSTITQLLNEGQQAAIEKSRCLRESIIFSLTPNVTYYSLPDNYLTIQRVTIGYKYLQEMSPAALDGRSRGWEQAQGYPTYYFVNFSSRGLIGFAPWPGSATDTDTVKVEYDISATLLSSGSDVPFNAINDLTDFQNGLSYYASSVLSTIDNQPNRATLYMGLFTAVAEQMSKRCMIRPAYMPSATGSP